MTEGKDKVSYGLYTKLDRYFWKEGDTSNAFEISWSWNLMSRQMNIEKLTVSTISWDHDCLLIEYDRTKTDPNGRNTCLKHVYVNPYKPEV